MTTIAYRDGVMAGDTRAYSGDKHPIGFKTKVFRLADGTLVGISSSMVGGPTAFLQWLVQQDLSDPLGIQNDCPFLVQAIVVLPTGEVLYWNDGTHFTGPLSSPFIAIGSGEQTAHAAMMMGATPAEAVALAAQVDPWTGGEIVTVSRDA